MRVPPVFAISVLLSLALAGCSGTEEAPTDDAKVAAETGISEVPEWTEGMYWTYETPIGTSSYIVTGTQGGAYIVETNDKNVAYYDALWDISFLGEIRKSDLAGSQQGQPVVMFDWPLEPGKQWTTNWDGEPLEMTTNPMGPGQYHVTGKRSGDDLVVEYHYNAAVKWFEYIVFYNETSGDEAFRLDLQDSGEQFSGSVYRYQIGEMIAYVSDAQGQGVRDESIDAQWNELAITFLAVCGGDPAGQIAIGMNDPENTGDDPVPMAPLVNEPQYGLQHDCQAAPAMSDSLVVSNPGGTWEVGMLVGSPNSAAHIFVEPRNLEIVAIG